jgi:hypothetical protein
MNFDVFISYPHQNKTVADAVCAKLEAEGVRCWIAPRDISPSAEWAASIVESIDACRIMVLVFSSDANRSKQVHREVQRAFDGEKPVIPFRIEEVAPEGTLAFYMPSVHWLDAVTPPLEQHLEKLAEKVRAQLQAPANADVASKSLYLKKSSTGFRRGLSKGAVGIGVALAILLVVAFTLWRYSTELTNFFETNLHPAVQVGSSDDILKNLVLASHGEPLSFAGVENDSAFSDKLRQPLNLETFDIFKDYPRELLFWLFADSFQFQLGPSPLNALDYAYKPPSSYGCPRGKLEGVEQMCFRDWVWAAVLSGLTVESKIILNPGGGNNTDSRVKVTRFCFSPFLQHHAVDEMGDDRAASIIKYLPISMTLIKPDQYCGNWSNQAMKEEITQPQEDTYKIAIGPYTSRIVPRSAYGVFEFLGNLLKVQDGHVAPNPQTYVALTRPGLPPVTDVPPILITEHDEPLITVLRDAGANCSSRTSLPDGKYCVPQSATNTKSVLNILSQLILETAPGKANP